MEGLLIDYVQPGSIAEELEIAPGDRLVAIDGHRLRDIIDYQYYGDGTELVLEILKADGEVWEMEVERDPGEPLGLTFAPPAPAKCGNRCVFCFVHQLPKGLRALLYVKDEDYRLSFLYGNYVTLANIGDEELALRFLPSGKIQRFRLALAAKPYDVFFLCHVPTQNTDNSWNTSNLLACEHGRSFWHAQRSLYRIPQYFLKFARQKVDVK